MPNLYGLFKSGHVFERIYTPAPWTLPAHASLFTSLYPSIHGVRLPTEKLSNAMKTLAEVLQNNGYYTIGLTEGNYVSALFGFQQGFHHFSENPPAILGSDFESEQEVRLIVDAGPLGYTNIAAHGHADALSFTLSIAGLEFLVDPGTYAYHTQKKWRDYFRGTSAHNTVRVDKQDQSVGGGNFMWLEKAVAECEEWAPGEDIDYFKGILIDTNSLDTYKFPEVTHHSVREEISFLRCK